MLVSAAAATLLLLLLSLCELCDMVTCCLLRADCSKIPHKHLERTKAPRTFPRFTLVTLFSHVNVHQREAVFRDDCFAQRLSCQIGDVSSLLILRTRNLLDLISSYFHKYATSMCFNFPIPCRCTMYSVAFASMPSTGFNS